MVKKKRRRLELWETNPHCHWCGILTDIGANPQGLGFPNQATVDHLYNRLDPERHINGNADKQVLACYKCNAQRGREYQQEQQRLKNPKAFDPEVRPLIKPPPLTYQISEVFPDLPEIIK